MKRAHIPMKTKLAAALLQTDAGQHYIPYLHSKLMTADQIISLFQLDHYPIRHADGGTDEPWNLTWLWIGEHREKTKRDVKEMAKTKRIHLREWRGQYHKSLAANIARPKRKIPSRPFPKGRKFRR
jgi:hypothetical protein